jgi:hypothetical protein
MRTAPELSPMWYIGMGVIIAGFVAYIAEELYWISKRQGRPCGQCGRKIPIKSFTVLSNCPHCGLPLD